MNDITKQEEVINERTESEEKNETNEITRRIVILTVDFAKITTKSKKEKGEVSSDESTKTISLREFFDLDNSDEETIGLINTITEATVKLNEKVRKDDFAETRRKEIGM